MLGEIKQLQRKMLNGFNHMRYEVYELVKFTDTASKIVII